MWGDAVGAACGTYADRKAKGIPMLISIIHIWSDPTSVVSHDVTGHCGKAMSTQADADADFGCATSVCLEVEVEVELEVEG